MKKQMKNEKKKICVLIEIFKFHIKLIIFTANRSHFLYKRGYRKSFKEFLYVNIFPLCLLEMGL